MTNTVFFSWQSDTPLEYNKSFIWDAIVQACDRVTQSNPEESPRPIEGAVGVPGAPNIVDTIFRRIRGSSVFIADLTFIATSDKGRKIPNPNVLIELGYAAKAIGWERTILVMNSASGPADELPFDVLQHRWPIQFRVTPNTEVREQRQNKLIDTLEIALNDCSTYNLERASEMASKLDGPALCFIAANQNKTKIEMPVGSGAAVITEINAVIRQLLGLGALYVPDFDDIPYFHWTHSGLHMIKHLKNCNGDFLEKLQSMTR